MEKVLFLPIVDFTSFAVGHNEAFELCLEGIGIDFECFMSCKDKLPNEIDFGLDA